tara:strand:- start:6023 stop:6340 length:318 start_codon:yes stop_codon:yes gene_type:complete
MSHILNIEIFETEGALVRLLGLIERRGFTISSMAMSAPSNGSARVTVDIASRGGMRQIEVLTRQIERLFDVHAVSSPSAPDPLSFVAERAAARPNEWRAECPGQP